MKRCKCGMQPKVRNLCKLQLAHTTSFSLQNRSEVINATPLFV